MTLDGLEARLREKYAKRDKTGHNAKVHLIRYADDFIATGASHEILDKEVKPLVEEFLQERGLKLSQEKTHITHIQDGFDFLGQNIREYGDKVLTKPSKKNVQSFLTNIREIIRKNAQATPGNLIAQLNPKIKGWSEYHRHAASKHTFNAVDHAIHQAIWRWAKRRHPKKSRRWVKDKYFLSAGGRHWIFYGTQKDKDGKIYPRRLRLASDTPIRRHVKIKSIANPYDPQWEAYFEERLAVKMMGKLAGQKQLRSLWKEQNGDCPVCQEKITVTTGGEIHHLTWRTRGGSDTTENLILLHPTCHKQVHSSGIKVVKPCPEKGI